MRARLKSQALRPLPEEDRPFEGDPPEDVHFGCGSCFRQGVLRRADCFSETPLPKKPFANSSSQRSTPQAGHVFEGRCFGCARFFRGRLEDYERGRRRLWARFLRETSLRVMES
jgi:hypothetical protein